MKINDSKKSLLQEDYLENKSISFRLTNKRWIGLLLACLSMFGSYYCFDNPQALQTVLVDPDGIYHYTNTQYSLLYSVYSFPNIVLPFFGGILIDKMGVRIGIFVFTSILIAGQSVFALGGYQNQYWLMLMGRVIFGLGGECLSVAQSVIVSSWFNENDLALALGLNISVARLGSTLNSILTPMIYDKTNSVTDCLLVGIVLCIFSWCTGLILIWMDKESDRREGKIQRESFIQPEEEINFSDIFKFNQIFWVLCINCALIYGAFYSFTGFANNLLTATYNLDKQTSGNMVSIIYIISASVTPFFGGITDRIGRRGQLMIVSLSTFIIAHSLLAFLPQSSSSSVVIVPIIMTGLFYASYASIIWPCIPLVVEPNMTGTAFGIVNSVQNLNLVISPLLYGFISDSTQDSRNGYFWPEIFIICQVIIGLLIVFYLNVLDKRGNQVLNSVKKIDPKQSRMSARLSMRQ